MVIAPANERPLVSVATIVTKDRGFDSVFRTLDSFLPQEGPVPFEMIVVDARDADRERRIREHYPWVTLIQTERLRPVPYQRNVAVENARGDIVAFVDDHVAFRKDFLKQLVSAFASGVTIVGGSVANGNPETLTSWVHHFCEYHQWFPTLPPEERVDLPGANLAYRADVLRRLGPFAEDSFGLETHFLEKAGRAGEKMSFHPGLVVAHRNFDRWGAFCKRRFNYGRRFAARRGLPRCKRFLYVTGAPLIALVEYLRILNHARSDRTYLAKFIACTPLLVPTLFVWVAGESLGYAFGGDDRRGAD